MAATYPGQIKGSVGSTCTQRVLAVAYEHGIELPVYEINFAAGEHKQPPYTDSQIFGQIPLLVDNDGFTLFESRAISRYIDAQYGGKLTFANDRRKNAKVENWISVETFKFDPAASGLTGELVFKPLFGQTTDPAKVEQYKKTLHDTLVVYDKHLSTNTYLIGSDFSLADIVHLPYATHTFKLVPEFLEKYPNVKRWFTEISSRPAWQKVSPKK